VRRRRRLPRAEREAQTLEVARRLFADRGYAAVTMDEVAAAVGVTKPLLYNYFGNKDGLVLAMLGPASERLVATVVGAVESSTSPAGALRAGMGAFFAYVDEDREAWRVLFDESLPSTGEVAQRVAQERRRLSALVSQTLLARIPVHARERSRAEVEGLSVALLGAAESLARWWLTTDGELTAEQVAELLISTVEPGLRERAGGLDAQPEPTEVP
jgi:AcrR family transcriptional regulator